jgi:hypothetical protein
MGLLDILGADPSSPRGMQLQGLLGGLTQMGGAMAQAGQMRPVGQPGPGLGDAFNAFGTGRRAAITGAMQDNQMAATQRQMAAWQDAASGAPKTPEGTQLFNAIPARNRSAIFAMGPEAGFKALSSMLTQQPVAASPGQTLTGPDGEQTRIPITPEDHAYRASGRSSTSVSVNNPPQIGAIPVDHRAVYDGSGRLSHFEVIPGSSTARGIEKDTQKETSRAEFEAQYGRVVLDSIKDVRKLAEGVMPIAGVGGSVMRNIPGTSAADVSAKLDTIKANIGFSRLQQMRESSPTGGALGQVAVKELDMLQATLGNLAQTQSTEQLMANLGEIDRMYQRYIGILSGRIPVGEGGGGGQVGAPAPATPAIPPPPPGFTPVRPR